MLNKFINHFKRLPLWQLMRFGIIGVLAAVVHMCMVYFLVSYQNLAPLIANIFAFMLAFSVSYLGHQYWTFAAANAAPHFSLQRFLLVAIGGFLLNEFLFYLLLDWLHVYYLFALAIVLAIVPPITFVCSKFWAFKNSSIRTVS